MFTTFQQCERDENALICNWNNTVPEEGIVFILGDFCPGQKVDVMFF